MKATNFQTRQQKEQERLDLKYGDQTVIERKIEQDAMLMFKKRKEETINGFVGYFNYLQNEYPTKVRFNNEIYNSVSHAYIAAQTEDPLLRRRILKAPTVKDMLEISVNVVPSAEFMHRRLGIMNQLLKDKFRRNRELRERLKMTNQKQLLNTFTATGCSQKDLEDKLYWGQAQINKVVQGQNYLGTILQEIRNSIQNENEVQVWLRSQFDLLQADQREMPTIQLEVFKEGENIESITLKGKQFFLFGRNQSKVDVPLLHDSISREHAVILFDQHLGALLIDLGSTSGTKLNNEIMQENIAMPLQSGNEIMFGASTRLYKVQIDFSRLQRALNEKQKALRLEIQEIENLSDSKPEDIRRKLGSNFNETLYVGNLPYHFEQADVKQLFQDCGHIKSIELKKGFAFVTMADSKGVRRVLNYDGHKVMGRALKIKPQEKQVDRRDKSRSRSPIRNSKKYRERSESYDRKHRRQRQKEDSYSDQSRSPKRYRQRKQDTRRNKYSSESSRQSYSSHSSSFDSGEERKN